MTLHSIPIPSVEAVTAPCTWQERKRPGGGWQSKFSIKLSLRQTASGIKSKMRSKFIANFDTDTLSVVTGTSTTSCVCTLSWSTVLWNFTGSFNHVQGEGFEKTRPPSI